MLILFPDFWFSHLCNDTNLIVLWRLNLSVYGMPDIVSGAQKAFDKWQTLLDNKVLHLPEHLQLDKAT